MATVFVHGWLGLGAGKAPTARLSSASQHPAWKAMRHKAYAQKGMRPKGPLGTLWLIGLRSFTATSTGRPLTGSAGDCAGALPLLWPFRRTQGIPIIQTSAVGVFTAVQREAFGHILFCHCCGQGQPPWGMQAGQGLCHYFLG